MNIETWTKMCIQVKKKRKEEEKLNEIIEKPRDVTMYYGKQKFKRDKVVKNSICCIDKEKQKLMCPMAMITKSSKCHLKGNILTFHIPASSEVNERKLNAERN